MDPQNPATPPVVPPAVPETPPVTPPAVPTPPAVTSPTPVASEDGKGGKDAVLADLAKERDKRQELEQQLAASNTEKQAQLDAIATALGLKEDTSDPAKIAEQLAESQRVAAENASALTRFQVAVEKAVPAHLVEFVTGSTREEVEASVAKVLAAFGAASAPGTPQPDPSQGQQGAPASLDVQIAAATAAGNTREAIRLKARKGVRATP